MKQLKKITENPEEYYQYFLPEYEEPLLEYVSLVAHKCIPVTQMDLESGYGVSRAIGYFVTRYFENKIDKSFLQKYFEDKNLQKTIVGMGYDIDKFWYLTLFIYDFSFGYCYKGIKLNDTPRESIEQLIKRINENVEPINDKNSDFVFKAPMNLSLKVKGKHNFTVDNPRTLHFLSVIIENKLDELEKGLAIDSGVTSFKTNNGKIEFDTLPNSKHIWIFAKIFQSFFKLNPSVKTKKLKGSTIVTTQQRN